MDGWTGTKALMPSVRWMQNNMYSSRSNYAALLIASDG